MVESRIEIERDPDHGTPVIGIYAPHQTAGKRGLVTIFVMPRSGKFRPKDRFTVFVDRLAPRTVDMLVRHLRLWRYAIGQKKFVDREEPWEALQDFIVERAQHQPSPSQDGLEWWSVRATFADGIKDLDMGQMQLSAENADLLRKELTRLFIEERGEVSERLAEFDRKEREELEKQRLAFRQKSQARPPERSTLWQDATVFLATAALWGFYLLSLVLVALVGEVIYPSVTGGALPINRDEAASVLTPYFIAILGLNFIAMMAVDWLKLRRFQSHDYLLVAVPAFVVVALWTKLEAGFAAVGIGALGARLVAGLWLAGWLAVVVAMHNRTYAQRYAAFVPGIGICAATVMASAGNQGVEIGSMKWLGLSMGMGLFIALFMTARPFERHSKALRGSGKKVEFDEGLALALLSLMTCIFLGIEFDKWWRGAGAPPPPSNAAGIFIIALIFGGYLLAGGIERRRIGGLDRFDFYRLALPLAWVILAFANWSSLSEMFLTSGISQAAGSALVVGWYLAWVAVVLWAKQRSETESVAAIVGFMGASFLPSQWIYSGSLPGEGMTWAGVLVLAGLVGLLIGGPLTGRSDKPAKRKGIVLNSFDWDERILLSPVDGRIGKIAGAVTAVAVVWTVMHDGIVAIITAPFISAIVFVGVAALLAACLAVYYWGLLGTRLGYSKIRRGVVVFLPAGETRIRVDVFRKQNLGDFELFDHCWLDEIVDIGIVSQRDMFHDESSKSKYRDTRILVGHLATGGHLSIAQFSEDVPGAEILRIEGMIRDVLMFKRQTYNAWLRKAAQPQPEAGASSDRIVPDAL